jgi:hypothetical protein
MIGLLLCVSALGIWWYTTRPLDIKIGQLGLYPQQEPAPSAVPAATAVPSMVSSIETFSRAIIAYGAPAGNEIGAVEPGRTYERLNDTVQLNGIYWRRVSVANSGRVWVRETDLGGIATPTPTKAPIATPNREQQYAPLQPTTPYTASFDLDVRYPEQMRLGDDGDISLSIYPVESKPDTTSIIVDIASARDATAPAIKQQIDIPVSSDLYDVSAVASIRSLSVNPVVKSTRAQQHIRLGETIRWDWIIKPDTLGSRGVTILLDIESKAKQPSVGLPQSKRIEIPFTVEVIAPLGLTVPQSTVLSQIIGFLGIGTLAESLDLWERLRKLFPKRVRSKVKKAQELENAGN